MKSSPPWVSWLLLFLPATTSIAHMSAEANGSSDYVGAIPVSGPEMHAVSFKPGRPTDQDDFLAAVADPNEAVAALNHDIELIEAIPSASFAVIATTDNKECQAEECAMLSLRRARLVHDWLVSHGISPERLRGPVGRGNAMPANFESSEEERSIARSAQVIVR
jgi:OOP family OmpA-OmpF porin